jgi:aminopeptidase
MPDPRVEAYARLLVEDCLDIAPRAQVLVAATFEARPLAEEVIRQLARKGAYAIPRLSFTGYSGTSELAWILEAPPELIAELPPVDRHLLAEIDAIIAISAPENTRAGSSVPPERRELLLKSGRDLMQRMASGELPWVGCQFPCQALAQDAEMSLAEFEDFLYGAVLLDWNAEGERMRRYAERIDGAEEVRIVGPETNLRLSLRGRHAKIDAGGANIPGGEFFYSPVENSAEGTIAFTEFPAVLGSRELTGIRFRFEAGRIVEASAERHEDFLLNLLDTDEGARRLGELGIGCNPGITRFMRNTLFDEKIDGTVHLAIGQGFPELGGTNESAIHEDIVKDLRSGGELWVDGELVQKDGAWRL